jgi:hypothetical protein
MFNFFKKTDQSDGDDNSKKEKLASIEFYIQDPDDPKPRVSINIDDYDEDSVNSLCKIVNVLADDTLVLETYNIIQTFLLQEEREDILLKVLTNISQQKTIKSKFKNADRSSEPYIKPSELK